MTKKNVASVALVDIENGRLLAVPPVNRTEKSKKGKQSAKAKATKPPAAMQTCALEPQPKKLSIGEKIDRTPDELFERVTSGLIQLDNTKRMQALTTGLLTFALRFFAVMLGVGLLFVLLALISVS